MTGVNKKDMIGQGDHAYAVPFYGERRRQLLDLLDKDDKEIASNYQYVQRKGNTLYAEVFTPALFGGRGAHVWATGAPIFDPKESVWVPSNPFATLPRARGQKKSWKIA
jgi:hypothetical protein